MKQKAFDFSTLPQMKKEALTFAEYQDPKTHELKTDIYINPSAKVLQAGVFDWGTLFAVLMQPLSSAFYTASKGFTLESVVIGAAGVGSYFYGKNFVKRLTIRGRIEQPDRATLRQLVEEGTLGSPATTAASRAFADRAVQTYAAERVQATSNIADNLTYEARRGGETVQRSFIEASDLGDKSKTSTVEQGTTRTTVSRETYAPLTIPEQEQAIRSRLAEIRRIVLNQTEEILTGLRNEGIIVNRAALPNLEAHIGDNALVAFLRRLRNEGIVDPTKLAESLTLEIGENLAVYRDELRVFLSEPANLPQRVRAITEFGDYLSDERIAAKIRRTFNKDFDKFVAHSADQSVSGEQITRMRLNAVWKHMPDDFKSYFIRAAGSDAEAFNLFYSSARATNLLIRDQGIILREGRWQGFFNRIADTWNEIPGLKRLRMNPNAVRSAIANHVMAGVIATAVLFLAPTAYSVGEWGYGKTVSVFKRDITPEATAFLAIPVVASLLERNQYPKTLELLKDDEVLNYIVANPILAMAFQEVGTYQFLEANPEIIKQILDNPSAAIKLLEQVQKNVGPGQQQQSSPTLQYGQYAPASGAYTQHSDKFYVSLRKNLNANSYVSVSQEFIAPPEGTNINLLLTVQEKGSKIPLTSEEKKGLPEIGIRRDLTMKHSVFLDIPTGLIATPGEKYTATLTVNLQSGKWRYSITTPEGEMLGEETFDINPSALEKMRANPQNFGIYTAIGI
ncbi:hypothetical protein COU37_02175 [Candidatus Micrarchaeota archaeon CG10_big_fil_rev_8_21_14_0_10_45_29]|nr:MAG: hypothetical protein COU37_02175 [Candidatus Micrarchaeota archaeon CG10_big_fil_rev_8_21_14_0_10_45_29]